MEGRFGIRRKGTAYLAVGLFALACAAVLNRPALALLGGIPLLLVALQSGGVRAGSVHVDRTLDLEGRHFEDDEVAVAFQVRSQSRTTRLVEVRDRLAEFMEVHGGSNYGVVAVKRGTSARLQYTLASPLFGMHEVGPTETRVEDPFGFFGLEQRTGEPVVLRVEPRPSSTDATQIKSVIPRAFLGFYEVSQPGSGFEFFGLRDYTPSDRMRDVNWKATSRVRKLVVNQHVKESMAEVAMILDAREIELAGLPTQSPWARTGRVAMEAAEELLRRRDSIRITVYGPGVQEVRRTGGGRQLQALLETLLTTRPEGETTLGTAVDDLLPTLSPRNPVILCSSLVGDPTAESAIVRLLTQDMRLLIFTSAPKRLEEASDASERLLLLQRQRVVEDLRGYGALVVDLEPPALAEGGGA